MGQFLIRWRALSGVDVEANLAALPESDRLEARRYSHPGAHDHFVAARGLLREMLTEHGVASEVALQRGPHGKPFIDDMSFNVSHSHDVVVCAIQVGGNPQEVGVDVEAPWRNTDIDAILGRYFAASEQEALRRYDDDARRRRFFELWTLKEAVLKATGKGLTTPLRDVVFDDDERWHLSAGLKGTWTLDQWELPTGHIVAVASPGEATFELLRRTSR